MKTKTEFVVIHETTLQSWGRDASTFVLFAALIGLGVLLDSSAMQWMGAIVGFIAVCARTRPNVHRVDANGARRLLDKIEAAE